jgi:hypothetical protein
MAKGKSKNSGHGSGKASSHGSSHGSSPSNLNPFALAGLLCGAVGIILGWVIPFLAITLGVFGVVLSRFTAKDVSRWLATTGLILGILGVLSGISRVIAIYVILSEAGLF